MGPATSLSSQDLSNTIHLLLISFTDALCGNKVYLYVPQDFDEHVFVSNPRPNNTEMPQCSIALIVWLMVQH